MSAATAGIGVVGCGIIAKRYVEGSVAFDTWQPVACADLEPAYAEAFAAEHGLRAEPFEELLADPQVEIVLNLTPPAVHAELTRAALAAGKHVYTEKPLAISVEDGRDLVAEAERLGLRLGSAPDTFLGSAYETGRRLIEAGEIGRPIGATATMLVGGPDAWHPNAEFFYRAGGGPTLDIAPYYLTAIASLLGPFESAAAFATMPTAERTLMTGPRAGETFKVEVPTHVVAVLQLERGPVASLTVSYEARGQYVSGLSVFGSTGMLELPDANAFGGELRIKRSRDRFEAVTYESSGARETRGLGLHEMVESMRDGRPHRASGQLALHVLETAEAILRSASGHGVVEPATPS